MQQRRGTASQWTSANPILNAGEMGWESDTNKFKIGDGTNHWADLDYFIDVNSTVNPAFGSSITFEGTTADAYETTLAITDPTADRTITFPDATGTVALTSDIAELSQDAIDSALTAGTGITKTYNDGANTLTIAVDTTAIQARVADVSDTEIGYLNGVTSAIQTQIDAKAPIASPTFTGSVTLAADPASALQAATKQYVDNTASGIVAKPQVLGATTTNIDATYNNGTAGVGATLTHNTNGAFPAEAGGASGWAVGKGILVKNQTNKEENGRYYVSDMGSVSTPYVLTRCSYCDEASEIPGAYIFVQDGTLAGTGWIQVVADPATFTVGTDDIDVYQFSGSGTITAGTGITVNGNQVSIDSAVTATLEDPTFTGTVDFTGATVTGISSYEAPTLGSTSIASGATVTTISGLTDIELTGVGSVQDELTLMLMGAI